MAMANSTQPIRFFKIILQTNLQRIKIPNKFTRRHAFGLSNPVLMKTPNGTKWKVYWKNINGEIWFEKGWNLFTQNYSLQHGCLVVFTYHGASNFNVLILDQNALEIDYDKNDKIVDISDDESLEILGEWLSKRSTTRKILHRKVRGEFKKTTKKTSSLNWPKGSARAQEVARDFISTNPFFTKLIKPNNLVSNRLGVPNLKGVIENKDKYVVLQIGKRSWKVKLLRYYKASNGRPRRFSVGWHLFASESRLKSGDVCVFELTNKKDLVFEVHVF